MPLYEYRCEACSRRFTVLVGMVARTAEPACPRCGGKELRRLISRFAVGRTEDDVLDDLGDPSRLGDPEDPRAMADWMRKVSREMGEDMDDDFEELVEEAVREEETGAAPMGDDAAPAGDSSAGSDLE